MKKTILLLIAFVSLVAVARDKERVSSPDGSLVLTAGVSGGQAFYHKIVTDLRDWNVNANMWKGYQLDVMPGIPD